MKAVTRAAVLAVVLAALAVPAAAQSTNGDTIGDQIFFTIDSLPGPLNIPISEGFAGLAFEVEGRGAPATGGAGSLSEAILLKKADYASPILMQKALEGEMIASVEIRFFESQTQPLAHLYTVLLSNVRISKFKTIRLSREDPAFADLDVLEELTLIYETITWSYVHPGAPSQPSYSFTVGGTE